MRHFLRWSLLSTAALLLALLAVLSLATGPVAAQGGPQPTPRPLFALPNPNTTLISRSGAIQLAVQQRYLVTANAFSGTASVVNIATGDVLAEVPVGQAPRSLAVEPRETWFAVTDHAGGTVSRVDLTTFEVLDTVTVGLWPWDVVTDGAQLYVALNGEAAIAEVDVASGEVLRRLPVPGSPAALTLWGDFLYITHLHNGTLSLLYLPTGQIAATTPITPDAGLAAGLWVDPFSGLAFVPATRLNTANPALTFDTTVWPVVGVFNLSDLSADRQARIALEVADRPVNMPYALTFDRARRWLWVVNAGSNDVSVIDLDSGFAQANVPVGSNPRGITRYADGSTAFVYNALDGTVSVIRAATATTLTTVTSTLTVTAPRLPVEALIGAGWFHSSSDPRLSEDRRLSCATCHLDGGSDGRVWVGFPGGAANTPVLYDLGLTRPWGWGGQWERAAAIETMLTGIQHGDGLAADGPDLAALLAYLDTLEGPAQSPGGFLPELLAAGEAIYAARGCADCHAAPLFTDRAQHDVGTGGTFDTPSLRWLWQSAPYFHDGRAASLRDVFAAPEPHLLVGRVSPQDLAALEAYLLSLPAAQP